MARDENDDLSHRFYEKGIRVTAAVTIQREPEELYKAWRTFRDLPRFVDSLESVEEVSAGVTRWTVAGPADRKYSWDADIINDQPNRLIAWKTGDDADVVNAGSISFRALPHRRGTEVHVVIEYLPPGGVIGNAIAKAVGDDPKDKVREALFRFRQVMEAGEIPTNKQQPAGSNASRSDRPGESDTRDTDADVRDIGSKQTLATKQTIASNQTVATGEAIS